MKALAFLPLIITSVLSAPAEKRQSSGPTVTISNGRVVGKSVLGVESFNGIPFAQPPVGQLRLKPPVAYAGQYPGGSFDATGTAKSCPQQSNSLNTTAIPSNLTSLILPFFDGSSSSSEDCLTLNVQRPAGTTVSSKLPVLFWIYGGGFEGGSTSMYDASQIILSGVNGAARGHPFVFVAVNYRLSAFGFLAGQEVQRDGSTNLGLRDQRLGLQWVADNIAAFGGDPTRVTIWGESAGAISVNSQLIINNGDNTYKGKPLFKAAIMNSGTIVPTEQVNTVKPQNIYNAVVKAAGCSGSSNTLSCLRSVPYATFKAASDSVPGISSYRALDLSYLPRPDSSSSFFPSSPEAAFQAGRYAKVPMIAGDVEDEGTLFSQSQSNITTTAQLITYLQSYFPISGANLVPGFVATYPDDITAGSPFRTGIFNNIYGQYKRLAAILGDFAFTLSRRSFLLLISDSIPRWSYLDTHLYGTPILGTFHGTDVLTAFYGTGPPSTVDTYRNAVIGMVYFNDPNKVVDLNWPQWRSDNTTGRQLLNIGVLNNSLLKDDFRSVSFQYLNANLGRIKI